MKWLILIVLLLTTIDPGDIRKINVAKAEAKKAYLAGDFQTAIARYRYLLDSMQVDEDEVRMNLANAYFQANDTTQALNAYLPLTQSKNAKLKSVAHQQMGVLNNRQGKLEEALTEFKQALKTDPTNEDARYNYEMVKKKIEEKKKQQQQDQKDKQQQDQNKDSKDQNDQNKDQQKQEQENKEQEQKDQQKDQKEQQDEKDKEQEQKDKEQQQKEQKENEEEQKDDKQLPPSVKEKLKDMNMTEEKARMILEAMKNQEVQYLQQNKRKATKPKDKNKPDW